MAEYEVYIYTPQNVLKSILTDFLSIDYTLVTNGLHALVLELPGEYEIAEDDRFELYRDAGLVGETQFIATEELIRLGAGGEYLTVIQAAGALKVLDWPLINYAPGLLETHHSGYAGNIIKQLARQNLGTLATDTARNMTEHLAIQADANDGTVITIDMGWRRLLEAIKEVAASSAEAGTDIYYDVIKNSAGKLELRTYSGQRGTDRSATVVLSTERGNLAEPKLTRSYVNAANRAIVGGTGQEIWRNVVEVPNTAQVNNSPWGYVKEHLHTCSAETIAAAIRYGDAYLSLNANKISLTGTPVDTPGTAYGTHYGWGDKISIEFLGYVAAVRIDLVRVTVQGGKETVQLDARGMVV